VSLSLQIYTVQQRINHKTVTQYDNGSQTDVETCSRCRKRAIGKRRACAHAPPGLRDVAGNRRRRMSDGYTTKELVRKELVL